MTESEWMASKYPQAMLEFVRTGRAFDWVRPSGKGRERLFRLFACACVRQVWHLLTDDVSCPECLVVAGHRWCEVCSGTGRINRSRKAVEVAERFADGEATEEERQEAEFVARQACADLFGSFEAELAWKCASSTDTLLENAGLPRWFSVSTKYAASQAALLRDIVGNPFRPFVARITESDVWICPCGVVFRSPDKSRTFGPCDECGKWEWRQKTELDNWKTPTVLAIARKAYQERVGRVCGRCKGAGLVMNFIAYGTGDSATECWSEVCPDCANGSKLSGTGRIEDGSLDGDTMAVLADALEDAGCDNEDILTHLRSPGPHVRGCWVLDLLLGKE